MTQTDGNRTSFLTELRRRGVLRVAASYAAIAWLLIQIGDAVSDPLELPQWALRSLIFTALLGFPVAVALAWFLEITPQGVAVDHEPPGARRPSAVGLRRYADLFVIALLLAVVGYLVARQPDVVGLNEKATIAVLPFENVGESKDGEVLALGIAESVLHQLASLHELDVISRRSSFSFRESTADAREIGKQLKAGYLLEGSIQGDRSRLRITTQLIDTRTGADVWSMRFDRQPRDIFAVQDEIALQVTRALQLTLSADALEHMKGQGTENVDAYLAYLQGRALLASDRVSDVRQAGALLERAVELDPKFPAAYVALADSELFAAEYEVTEDRQARFARALERGRGLVDKALSLDADNGPAYITRASVEAYTDLSAAEADYRHGLELSPNSAPGVAGLASVLYEDPARREEALALLDRARKLDPLQPAYDVAKAVYLAYELGDMQGADDLLTEVLRRNPGYQPALARIAEFRVLVEGRTATGIEYAERALSLDPASEATRRALIRGYLIVNDLPAARQVADEAENDLAARRMPILLYQRDWQRAGEAAYESLARQTFSGSDINLGILAIRKHARSTGDFERARQALLELSGVTWNTSGNPALPNRREFGMGYGASVALADVLISMGREPDGRALLDLVLQDLRREAREQSWREIWYQQSFITALALHGDNEEALEALERSATDASSFVIKEPWAFPGQEPAFDALRQDARFQRVQQNLEAQVAEQREELDRLRAEGRVPVRATAD